MPKLVEFDTLIGMHEVSITLFGQPSLRKNGEPIELKSRKGWALLTYLTLMPNPIPRESLATLLWPEQDGAGARRNLRRLLYTLNQSQLEPHIDANPEEISLNIDGEIDVLTFLQRLEEKDWAGAVTHYRGELLDGVIIGDSNLFESWITEQREQLRQQMLSALTSLTDQQLEANDYAEAETTLRQQLSLDNWNELIWRRLMTILAEKGRRAQALSAFNDCQQLLKKELGIRPSAETVALYESIRDGFFERESDTRGHFAIPPPRPLPHPAARKILIEKMETQWINNLLQRSTAEHPFILLKKKAQPTALAYPWTTLINRPAAQRGKNKGTQPIIDIFEAEGRGLLILGAPGAGKTTTLLALAKRFLERAKQDPAHPIPVILPLSSWQGEALEAWIATEINEKYRILRPMVADWLQQQQLMLLCDGLDELPAARQAECVVAINRFRETYGLTPIAVCARQADYEALPTPLNLNGAITLQALDLEQIDLILGDRYPLLKKRVSGDRALQKLMQSPLLLSLMISLFGSLSEEQLSGIIKNRSTLFRIYIEQQLNDKTDDRDGQTIGKRLRSVLVWLAKQLDNRGQAVFMLDRIQPDWLESRWLIIFYFFLSRFMGGFTLEVAWAFRDLGWGAVPAALWLGTFIGIIELILLAVEQRTPLKTRLSPLHYRLWRASLFAILISLILAPFGWIALVNGLIFGLFFGWRPPSHTAQDDIQMVEKLAWRWQTFAIGIGVGLLLGILVFAYNRADLYAAGTGLLSIIVLISTFGGLQGEAISTKSRPNEGMWLSGRNGLVGGAAVGGAMLVAALGIEIGRNASLLIPLLVGLQYFIMAALWYGGLDLLNHFTLRGFLALSGRLPFNVVRTLDEASRRRLMYRAGGGYLFLHAELRDALLDEGKI